MHSRVPSRLPAFVASALAILGMAVPALPAAGAEPPFEIVFPQEWEATDFRSTFGDGRSGGRAHKGNDLMAPRMTEVYAAADGVVIHVGTNRLSGRNLRIQHEEAWTTHYVHLNNDNPGTDDGAAPWSLTVAPGIEVGTEVEAGQLIAWVGDSGNAEWTASHTHFELRRNGTAINPYQLLRDAFEVSRERDMWLESQIIPDPPDYGTE